MHIRKQIIWNPVKKKYIGYVDYGHTVDTSDNQLEATSALVFLISAINAKFKIPVAYYLTDTMKAEELAKIIRDILLLVHEAGADSLSIIFNGTRVNLKTAKLLGCEQGPSQFENKLRTSIYRKASAFHGGHLPCGEVSAKYFRYEG